MVQVVLAGVALLVTVVVLAFTAFSPSEGPLQDDAAAAQRVAQGWAAAERTAEPRRLAQGWEVDAYRADGSVVEVALNHDLQLQELDEERGPRGGRALDELRGTERHRAVRAARSAGGKGRPRSVEREGDGSIEVNFVGRDGRTIEVELDRRYRVTDVDREERGDT